ncbi:unnamed protein product [Staurois parvus]|uniref:Uncharacterized protein n=1 Tax=Staurois parvus TaxID=386267 RepID=A0ABN9HIS0_9NEOB|nr:unnamed protein product [Staurois parvus]
MSCQSAPVLKVKSQNLKFWLQNRNYGKFSSGDMSSVACQGFAFTFCIGYGTGS